MRIRPSRSILAVLTLLLAGLAFLYAYRAQSPAVPTVSTTQAIEDVNNARVDTVVVEDSSVTLTLTDGRRERVETAGDPQPILSAVQELNRRLPGRSILVRSMYSPTYRMSWIGLAFWFAPLAIFASIAFFGVWMIARSRSAARVEQLLRLA